MEKQLILVVHGVGVREAGVATGHLSAALGERLMQAGARADPPRPDGPGLEALRPAQIRPAQTAPEPPLPEPPLPEPPWRPQSTDDFLLHEEDRFQDNGVLPVFPAHVRRFRRYDTVDPTRVRQERLVADYFWGDISATGTGGLRVANGLIKIVLGLSHAIRENAMDVFAGMSGRAVWMRRIARLAPLTIHGPIAAISIVLVVGLLMTLGLHAISGRALVPGSPEVAPVIAHLGLGAGTMLAGWAILQRSQVYLQRHLMGWLIATGGLVIASAMAEGLAPDAVMWVYGAIDKLIFGTECIYRRECVILSSGFAVLGALLMAAMILCWIVVIAAALAVQVASWAGRWFPERGRVRPVVAPAIALMTILWFVAMTAVWSMILLVHWLVRAATGYHLPRGLSVELVIGCLRLVTPAIAALVLLGIVAVALDWRKARAFRDFDPPRYLARRDRLANQHRLIVGRGLVLVLALFPAALVVLGVFTVTDCQFLPETSCRNLLDRNRDLIPTLIAVVGVVALILGLAGRRELATGVAIFTDVLVYLNDYSWRSRDAELGADRSTPPQTPLNTRTLTERACGLRRAADDTRQGYWLRGRIHSRMKVLMDTLLRDEAPHHVVIVAHSQGTVIAMEVIAQHGADWLRRMPVGATLKLVTMGSPYSHLYHSYFPSAFPDVAARPALARRAAGQSLDDGKCLSEWVNIFRIDDFVGTHIATGPGGGTQDDGADWPEEVAVKPNGHSNYWTDTAVFPRLRQVVAWQGSDGK